MVHVLAVIEGYPDDFELFEKEFNNRMYADGKARLRFREARLYTFAVNEVGYEEFLGDLKSLTGRTWGDREDESFQWNKAIGWIKKILWPFGLKELDFSKARDSGIRGSRAEGKVSYKLHFVPLGYVKEPRDKNDGSELV